MRKKLIKPIGNMVGTLSRSKVKSIRKVGYWLSRVNAWIGMTTWDDSTLIIWSDSFLTCAWLKDDDERRSHLLDLWAIGYIIQDRRIK